MIWSRDDESNNPKGCRETSAILDSVLTSLGHSISNERGDA